MDRLAVIMLSAPIKLFQKMIPNFLYFDAQLCKTLLLPLDSVL